MFLRDAGVADDELTARIRQLHAYAEGLPHHWDRSLPMMKSLLGKTLLSSTASTTSITKDREAEPYLPGPYHWHLFVAVCRLVPVAKDYFESESYDECPKKEAGTVAMRVTCRAMKRKSLQ